MQQICKILGFPDRMTENLQIKCHFLIIYGSRCTKYFADNYVKHDIFTLSCERSYGRRSIIGISNKVGPFQKTLKS